jgi:hypothetical protein
MILLKVKTVISIIPINVKWVYPYLRYMYMISDNVSNDNKIILSF